MTRTRDALTVGQLWAVGRADGRELFDGLLLLVEGSAGAVRDVGEEVARAEWNDGDDDTVLVAYRLVPVAIGVPTPIAGENLPDGDRDPDSWGGVEWLRLPGEEIP